ncbi:tRNA wybutosine-synthesizing protein 4 [Callorhinchus milii]|uniref:tRNA wybutosine-synthesizing protein 4 n=1 Tax=Callorhinchus milii TaxID=7868 RepID=UPI001C3FA057|nr:tRNA wybutosine-synthesizing protein 4 [Callorhinchus milii]
MTRRDAKMAEKGNRSKGQTGRDTAVQGTNDNSIVSKCSMASLGYFSDDFLKRFVNKTTRRAPLINRGYYVRAKAVDYVLRCFLKKTVSHSRRQILSLGAGFDSSYFRLKASGELENVVMYEVDFPDVVQRKAALIKNSQELVQLLGYIDELKPAQNDAVCLSAMDYKLLGVDLTEVMKLDHALMEAGLDPCCPTLLLSEVVLTYMQVESSSAVIHWAAERFSSAVFVIYEQICPEDPFGQVMQQHFTQLNATLHALVPFPGKDTQRKRFLSEGWEECTCLDMNEFYVGLIPEEEKQRIEKLEPFDEYEEWHLKCSHYLIVSASKGDLKQCLLLPPPPIEFCMGKLKAPDHLLVSVSLCEIDAKSPTLKRFAHSSALIAPHIVVTSGGFGERDGQHGRLRDVELMVKSASVWKCISPRDERSATLLTERMYHSTTALSDGRCLIFGGRGSPLKPATSVLCLKCKVANDATSSSSLSVEEVQCFGSGASPRWRHTATEITYKGQRYLFVYGGRSPTELVLGDCCFLNLEDYSWTDIPIDGPIPEGRHSHSACTWNTGVLIAGGLGTGLIPLQSVFFLRPTLSGFIWEKIETTSSIVPRYSHTAHIVGDELVLIGGVWIHSDSVPAVTLINLSTGESVDCYIDTHSLKWPLMLHNHSSVLLAEEQQILVLGGGGNCFSFGTHLNQQPILLHLPKLR